MFVGVCMRHQMTTVHRNFLHDALVHNTNREWQNCILYAFNL